MPITRLLGAPRDETVISSYIIICAEERKPVAYVAATEGLIKRELVPDTSQFSVIFN